MGVVFKRIEPGKISISNMKLILMSLLVLGPCYGMDAMFKKMMKQTAKHTFDAACFGETNKNNYDLAVGAAIEKCMQLAPAIDLINILSPSSPFTSLFPSINPKNPFRQFQEYQDLDQLVSLWRTKRSADSEITTGLLQPDEEDFMEFLGDFADFKGSMATKMGNLTCVLTEMNLLTSPNTRSTTSPSLQLWRIPSGERGCPEAIKTAMTSPKASPLQPSAAAHLRESLAVR